MSDERELIAEREKKVEEIRALGANPYANGFTPTHTAAEIAARFAGATPPPAETAATKGAPPALLSDEHFKIAGRIVAYRGFGKAAFVKLLDRTGRDPGLGAQGPDRRRRVRAVEEGRARRLHRRRRQPDRHQAEDGGELTIVAENVVILTKATRPLPEKWHGLIGRRGALPPALRRPGRQPGGARGVPQALARIVARRAPLPRRARLPRGRDADDAFDPGRRGGASRSRPTTTRSISISSCASRPSCT